MKTLTILVETFILLQAMIQPCTPTAYMTMVFNSGTMPIPAPCTSIEFAKINGCFAGGRRTERQLRSGHLEGANEHHIERKEWPLQCAELCAGYVPRTCLATRCKGYRRDLEQDPKKHEAGRGLQYNSTAVDIELCELTISSVGSCLNRLVLSLSSTCRMYVSKRRGSCKFYEFC